MQTGPWGKAFLQQDGGGGGKLFRSQGSAEKRHAEILHDFKHGLGGSEISADYDTGDLARSHGGKCFTLLLNGHFAQKRHFTRTEELNPFMGEVFEMTGQGEGWAVDTFFPNLGSKQGLLFCDEAELQLILEGIEEIADGDAFDDFRCLATGHFERQFGRLVVGSQTEKSSPR